jgi:hypothetical protein
MTRKGVWTLYKDDVYDSEDDRKALKQAKKKRKALAQIEKAGSKTKRTVYPESVANIGGPE